MTPPLSEENALYRAAALCSRCEQAESDIRTKLKGWGISGDEAEKIITRLISEKYIDENRYAHAYCRDKFRFSSWGRVKIAFALRQKHISSEAIEAALAEIDENAYQDALQTTLRAKFRSLRGKEPAQVRASLYRFAASRGFEPNLVMSAITEITKDAEAE